MRAHLSDTANRKTNRRLKGGTMDQIDLHEIAGQQIYELKPLEMVSAKDLGVGQGYSILRVPGGWLFLFLDSTCFVPMDFEFERNHGVGQLYDPKTDPRPKKKTARKKSSKKAKTQNGY
jgi:hypothetical protein